MGSYGQEYLAIERSLPDRPHPEDEGSSEAEAGKERQGKARKQQAMAVTKKIQGHQDDSAIAPNITPQTVKPVGAPAANNEKARFLRDPSCRRSRGLRESLGVTLKFLSLVDLDRSSRK